ncbi:hepatic lectin-like isoform X2 [Heliangelus exortis]|uniref:hepatic lectin-like isoform X2 n=1 Tax=Heliangelus exortis TaxID=472823 RepID=UPI003A8E50FF
MMISKLSKTLPAEVEIFFHHLLPPGPFLHPPHHPLRRVPLQSFSHFLKTQRGPTRTQTELFQQGFSLEWEYFAGKCYYFSLKRMSWHKAKAQCEEMHSHLAIIDSFAKQNFLMFRTRNERFWIGLTDENSEGEWKWLDGTDPKNSFTFWKEGEPNNSGHNEDCAHLWGSGEWNDVYCTYECYYICEKPLPN